VHGATEGCREEGAAQRWAALRASGLLDAPAEERFDRLTRLARRLLRTPVALLTLLDPERQFFLSAQGLPEPWASLRETPLSHSFCRSVVETGLSLTVPDAREDPRLRGNPAIEALGFVAYLAVPLTLPDGCVVGALCAIDREPRAWATEDEQALADLAGAAIAEVAAGLRLRELEAASAALGESEARYRALFEVSPQMVWFTDADGACTYVNQHYTEFVGGTAEQAMGEGWLAALHPEDRERVRAAWAGAVASGAEYENELRLRRACDGAYRWVLFRGAPLRGAGGRAERWIGVGIDIDERKRAEEALRTLIEALGMAVYTTDAAGRLTFYNQAAVALWGWRPSFGDTLWHASWRLYWPDGTPLPYDQCPMAVALRENRPVHEAEAMVERPDGTRVPIITYPTPLRDETGALIGAVNVLVDITKHKAAETALAESEARLHVALEASRLAFWELDIATGRVVRSPHHDRTYGHEALLSDWSYDVFLGHVLPEDRAAFDRDYQAALEDRLRWPIEFRIRRADDGELRWLEVYGRTLLGPDGRVSRLIGVTRDVTDRRRTEAALRESEARLRSIVETVPDAMVVIDERGAIESFSAAAEQLFGYSAGEAVGRNVSILMPDPDSEQHDSYLARYAATGERRIIGVGRVVVGRRKDGSAFPMEIAVGEVLADGRRLFTGFMRDLTARQATEARLQELQAELLHVSRLSAAGEMATALAHELNQPLTAVASAIRAARRMLASASPDDRPGAAGEVQEAMDLAAEQALRAGQIVRRIRNFVAGDSEAEKRLEDLRRLIEEAGALALVGARERGVHVAVHFEAELPPVFVDRIQVQQVLFNLVRNALEAMGEVEAPRRRELVVAASAAGPEMVEVAVADTGPGLAPEIADSLFNSFVSTKPGGLGMGLSICRSIVEAHGGRLWAERNPAGGTVFRFTLPAAPVEALAG
jgi:PAS domain S-box-containing protein